MTMSDLTGRLGVTRGALTGLVDRLEESGLVARCPDQQDRRVVHLALTPQGQTTMAEVEHDWREEVQRWLAPLDDDSRHAFSKGLNALLEMENAHGPQ
ncbi:putative HTH-type transcriptional regulator YusO [compost metagenome]